jgi:hypothetical protein
VGGNKLEKIETGIGYVFQSRQAIRRVFKRPADAEKTS